MASTNMASATSRFMLAAGVPTAGSGSGISGRVSFASAPNRLGGRLVVRADPEAPAEPAEGEGAVATKPKAEKPPPIGPKRGAKVHIYSRNTHPCRLCSSNSHRIDAIDLVSDTILCICE
jgi:photosystem I subunit 4